MISNHILLSIIIPTYNYSHTLQRAIDSVLIQLNKNHELIVVDDGSTDETPALLNRLRATMPESVRFIRKKNGGVSSARNLGIHEAKGTYYVFLDADDELASDALALFEQNILEYPQTEIIVGGYISVWPDGKRRRRHPGVLVQNPVERLKNYLIDKSFTICNGGACAIHRSVFNRGLYPESFRSGEDVPVFAQALANHVVTVISSPLVTVYKHEDSLRHQFSHAKAGGLALVEEVFSEKRLGKEFQHLKPLYLAQRCLSLFRSAFLAQEYEMAKYFYRLAIQNNRMLLFNFSYTKKALITWLH